MNELPAPNCLFFARSWRDDHAPVRSANDDISILGYRLSETDLK